MHPAHSRNKVVSNIVSLSVNDSAVKRSFVVRPRDKVRALIACLDAVRPAAVALPLQILYEDGDLLVLNKAHGIAVHPGNGMAHDEVTITQALCHRYPHLLRWQEETRYRAGIVHRLDKETSGVLLVAKHEPIAAALQMQFRDRSVHKRYLAAVYGRISSGDGEVIAAIARSPHRRTQFVIATDGKMAHTGYKIVEVFDTYTMVNLFPVTGRTHQLRVHMRSIHHPVVGDRRYALGYTHTQRPILHTQRLMLHAEHIAFDHPSTGERCTICAPLPPVFRDALRGELVVQ